ncbi:MAG: amidohydrolase [Chloroflexota bacterium]|nr:amidohydrolase [Chloroflexota bacterium]
MQAVDLLILHGLVVTMDAQDTVLEDGALAISGSKIVAVGRSSALRSQYSASSTIDASQHVVMPGLINAHTHLADILFRGLVEDLSLEEWLARLWVAEKAFVRPDTVRLGARLAFAEMIRSGTTTALDMFWYPEVSVDEARQVGFRLMTGPIYIDVDGPDQVPLRERTARGRELLQEMAGDPLVVPCVLPHSTYTITPAVLKEAKQLADEFGVFLSTHVSETVAEVATVRARYGRSPLLHLEALGLLDDRAVLAHCVHLADEEIELLARWGSTVAHCPLSNLKLGSGIAPIRRMRQERVPVTVGTDGPVSSNDLDMWTAIRVAASLHKGFHQDPTLLPAREVVRMVTCDAAAALGLAERIGSIAAGKDADLILLHLDRPHLVPMYDLYAQLVYTVGRSDVSTTIIHGRVVMRDRQLATIDEERAMADVRQLAEEVVPDGKWKTGNGERETAS